MKRCAMIPVELLARLTPGQLRVYAAIAGHANKDRVGYPSMEGLAQLLGIAGSSIRHLQREVKELEEQGFIRRVMRTGKRTEYHLLDGLYDEEPPASDATPPPAQHAAPAPDAAPAYEVPRPPASDATPPPARDATQTDHLQIKNRPLAAERAPQLALAVELPPVSIQAIEAGEFDAARARELLHFGGAVDVVFIDHARRFGKPGARLTGDLRIRTEAALEEGAKVSWLLRGSRALEREPYWADRRASTHRFAWKQLLERWSEFTDDAPAAEGVPTSTGPPRRESFETEEAFREAQRAWMREDYQRRARG